ncbi:MAG: hypothetical protein K2J04_04175, partial [Lachnospiraceae bacterium]|nr:hypothetical protein [Lachnospiraceae bacterium]
MKRKVKDLQDAVNSIQIPEEMQKEIIQNIKTNSFQKKKTRRNISMAATAAGIVIAVGLVSVPVRALVNSLIQERMEAVPQEELDAIVEDVEMQQAEADQFSRAYTEKEESRMSELYGQYQSGTFPTGELMQVESIEEAGEGELYFLVPEGAFYLPDRELTDEELLEIIDFYYKREYALNKRYEEEFAEEIAQKKEEQAQMAAEAVEVGGVTEQEAIETASEWLEKIFGITGEGLERNNYFDNDIVIAGETGFYHVNWTDFPNRQYYYFYISAKDGTLSQVMYSGGKVSIADAERITAEKAAPCIPQLKQKADAFMKEQFQVTCEDVYSRYYAVDGIASYFAEFIYVEDSNTAYAVTYTWDGNFKEFRKYHFTGYQQEYERAFESVQEAVQYKHWGENIEDIE